MRVSQVTCDVLGYAQGGAIMLTFKSTISLAYLTEPFFLQSVNLVADNKGGL
jgi:hypothetical protein